MAKKKNNQKKAVEAESMLNKIAGEAAYMAGKMVVAKNNLVEKAGGAIETVKTTIQNITAKKKADPKGAVKTAVAKAAQKVVPTKKAAKKTVKAAVKKVARKAAPAKKAIKDSVKKVAKKAAPAKRAIKKAVKKIARKR